MEKLKQKYEKLQRALKALGSAIDILEHCRQKGESSDPYITYKDDYSGRRDSVVQRFEYSIDLFWKYLKRYVSVKYFLSDIKSPRDVIVNACLEGILYE